MWLEGNEWKSRYLLLNYFIFFESCFNLNIRYFLRRIENEKTIIHYLKNKYIFVNIYNILKLTNTYRSFYVALIWLKFYTKRVYITHSDVAGFGATFPYICVCTCNFNGWLWLYGPPSPRSSTLFSLLH